MNIVLPFKPTKGDSESKTAVFRVKWHFTSLHGFRLVPTSVTSNDFKKRNSPYFALFYRIR